MWYFSKKKNQKHSWIGAVLTFTLTAHILKDYSEHVLFLLGNFLLQIHFLTWKNVAFHWQIPQNRQDEPRGGDENGKRFGAHGWFSKFNVEQTDWGFDTTSAFFSPWMETLSSRPHANFVGSWFTPVLRCTGVHHLSASFLPCVLINLRSHWGERQTYPLSKKKKLQSKMFLLGSLPNY